MPTLLIYEKEHGVVYSCIENLLGFMACILYVFIAHQSHGYTQQTHYVL